MDEEFSLDHYWKLAFDWRNMYLCCEKCKHYKVNWFPVEKKRAPLTWTFNQIIKKEEALLIDPCHDKPDLHLEYDLDGKVRSISRKGSVTIDILNLNREDLLKARKSTIEYLEPIYKALKVLSNQKSNIAKARSWEAKAYEEFLRLQ